MVSSVLPEFVPKGTALVTTSFLFLLVRHLLLVARHLFLVEYNSITAGFVRWHLFSVLQDDPQNLAAKRHHHLRTT